MCQVNSKKEKKMPCPLPVLDPCRIGGGFIQCDKEWGFSSLFSVVGFGDGVSGSLDIISATFETFP